MTKHTYESLASSTDETLEQVMMTGTQPDLDVIAGSEYRGWNTPFFAATAGILRFKKGFFKDPSVGGAVRGYNKDIVAGGGLMDPWMDEWVDEWVAGCLRASFVCQTCTADMHQPSSPAPRRGSRARRGPFPSTRPNVGPSFGRPWQKFLDEGF